MPTTSAPELPSAAPTPRSAYAVSAPRAVRPLPQGGPPPTVIRDLDALFARDGRRASAPTPRPVAPPSQPPIDPARFAQMLLQKVESDFTPSHRSPSAAPASPAFASPPAAPPAPAMHPAAEARAMPRVVAFVPSPTSVIASQSTAEIALPADDEDVAALVPWYRRLLDTLLVHLRRPSA